MKKHKFNILPEMSGEEFDDLVRNIKTNGFDASFPVIVYEGAVLDGWNRYRAADKLGVGYVKDEFRGSDIEAIQYVIRSNARRNLSAQQRAILAVESTELIRVISKAVEDERRFQQSQSRLNTVDLSGANLPIEAESPPELTYEYDEITDNRPARTTTRKEVAKQFGVSENYVKEAAALKKKDPEKFEQVKSGQTTFQKIKKEEKATIKDVIGDSQDEFTLVARDLGVKIQLAVTKVEGLVNELLNAGGKYRVNISKVVPDITGLKPFKDAERDARTLKTLSVCPMPDHSKCNTCSGIGYVTEKDRAMLLDHLNHVAKGGITFEKYMAEQGGEANVAA